MSELLRALNLTTKSLTQEQREELIKEYPDVESVLTRVAELPPEPRAVHLPPDEAVERRSKVDQQESWSQSKWNVDFSDEQRVVAVSLVRDCLQHALNSLEYWVPRSLVVEKGHGLDIFLGLDLSEIDQEVMRRRYQQEAEVLASTQDLVSLHKKWGTDDA